MYHLVIAALQITSILSGLKQQLFIVSHVSTGQLNASADLGGISQDFHVALLSLFIVPGRVHITSLQT